MPVMKQLNIGGTTYDTVGEASVTRVVTTGTKIATITIDGTSSDLYAPSGSSVDPATASPLMDGTAAVGSSAKYAREDQVHPTDKSLHAALVSGTNIKTVNNESFLGSGNVSFPTVPSASSTAPLMDGTASSGSGTSYARGNHRHPTDTSRQETLVSGTNIKTINGNSILGSGNLTVGGSSGWTNITNAFTSTTADYEAYTDGKFVYLCGGNAASGALVETETAAYAPLPLNPCAGTGVDENNAAAIVLVESTGTGASISILSPTDDAVTYFSICYPIATS